MAQWQRNLKLSAINEALRNDEVTPAKAAAEIVSKLKSVRKFSDDFASVNDELDDIITEFETIAEDGDSELEDLNDAMSALYDWGDTALDGEWNGKKVCWIET